MILIAFGVVVVLLLITNIGISQLNKASPSLCVDDYFKSARKINGVGNLGNSAYTRNASNNQKSSSYMDELEQATVNNSELTEQLMQAEGIRSSQFSTEQEGMRGRPQTPYAISGQSKDEIDSALSQIYNMPSNTMVLDRSKKTESSYGKAHTGVFELELEGLKAGITSKARDVNNDIAILRMERDGYKSR
jgi:hypothetical protein